ncbi:MAG: hypothetical protein ACKO6K_03755 [Chitinophagaceae bacterium]
MFKPNQFTLNPGTDRAEIPQEVVLSSTYRMNFFLSHSLPSRQNVFMRERIEQAWANRELLKQSAYSDAVNLNA